MSVKWIPLVVATGCGRFGFSAHDATSDAPTDAPADAAACHGTGSFTNLEALANVNTAGSRQKGGAIAPDGLALYLFSDNSSMSVATRASLGDPFGVPSTIAELDSFASGDPSITADNLEIYFMDDHGEGRCIFRSRRATPDATWELPIRLNALCPSAVGGPAISPDGLTLVYNTLIDPFDEGDLYLTTRVSRGDEFPAGALLANLPASSGYPVLSTDRLRLYFEHQASNIVELYTADRLAETDDFANVRALDELDSTTSNNRDISLSPSEDVVYWSTDRTAGDADIWTATRPCL